MAAVDCVGFFNHGSMAMTEAKQTGNAGAPVPRSAKGQGFPQILHDRSRAAGNELHRLLISLSTGTLAIYFLSLTGEAKPPLTIHQKIAAILSLLFVSLAAMCGLFSLFADVRRNYFWAYALQVEDKIARKNYYRERDKWSRFDRIFAVSMGISFALGMLMSLAYGTLRVLAK